VTTWQGSSPSSKPNRPPQLLRLIVGYGAVACAVPYLALKVVWLAGGQVGVADATMMRDASMVALNVVTAGMDLVAIAIALAFTHAWGLRVPAWLVLPPIWVAMGLLVRFVVAVPIITIARMLASGDTPTPTPIPTPSGPVLPWVYALVYTEFVGMGIGLTLAFVLYARVRWGSVIQPTTRAALPGRTRRVQVPLANTAALMAAAVGVLHLAWALGATGGLPGELIVKRTFSSHVINAVDGATMVAAAVGILMMVHGSGRQSFWVPLALTWVGSGFLFGWGLWGLVNVLGNTALVRGRLSAMSWLNLLGLAEFVAGLVIGMITLFLLAERDTAQPSHVPEHS
jgi:hypothetical protein